MAWSANDIALVVSTTATAMTAIAGIGLPLWTDFVSKRNHRKERLYSRIAEAVYYCIEHVDVLVRLDRHRAMARAYLAAGWTKPEDEVQLEEVGREFERRLAIIRLSLSELGIEGSEFNAVALEVRLRTPEFVVSDNKLSLVGDEVDLMSKQVKSIHRLSDEAAKLLKQVRQELGISL